MKTFTFGIRMAGIFLGLSFYHGDGNQRQPDWQPFEFSISGPLTRSQVVNTGWGYSKGVQEDRNYMLSVTNNTSDTMRLLYPYFHGDYVLSIDSEYIPATPDGAAYNCIYGTPEYDTIYPNTTKTILIDCRKILRQGHIMSSLRFIVNRSPNRIIKGCNTVTTLMPDNRITLKVSPIETLYLKNPI